uniref:Cytochrome c oxidase copper chaperone n=1 Tax=Parascaris univalens TaxID=6257 RepID=A0A915BAJ3_PARUN
MLWIRDFIGIRIVGHRFLKMSEKKDCPLSNDEPKKLKPCCACPQTKKARDECIVLNGEEKCGTYIEAHKKCLRDHGFDV